MAEALLAGGLLFALPADAVRVAASALRPAPLSGLGMLGIAVVGGQVVPVLAAAPGLHGGAAWVMLEGPNGRVVVAGEALVELPPEGAPPLVPPRLGARRAPAALPMAEGGWAVPMRGSGPRPVALAAELGALRMVLPLAALERVVAMPAVQVAPGAGPVALGYAVAAGAPVLVLDPGWLLAAGRNRAPAPAPVADLLVLFRHAGRRLGLPCLRVGRAQPGEATLLQHLDALADDLMLAPLAEVVAPPAPEPTRSLLVCAAGGIAFALPVEEVLAVIPPVAPTAAPGMGQGGPGDAFRGVVAHRGEVLPVLDAGLRMGLAAVLRHAGTQAPLLRLAGSRPIALAVQQVTGLRRIPERLVAAVAGEGLVSAVVALGEAPMPVTPMPVCRAAVLAGWRPVVMAGRGA